MASSSRGLSGITGHTQLATVIGAPVRHSMSPAIHNAGFAATGFDAIYTATQVAPGDGAAAVDAMRRFGWLGMSVTMPHKADVLSACDDLTPAAQALGAANCLFWHQERIVGDNTDGEGFVRGLAHELDFDCTGRACVIFGAGGAARAVVRALAGSGAGAIVVVNRSPERAAAAIAQAPDVARAGTADEIEGADLVINATPVGMAGTDQPADLPFDVARLGGDATVSDLIYHPSETPLLAAARARGLRCQNGLEMLVFQAAVQFEHWTGLPAPVDSMLNAVSAELADR